MTSYFIIGNCHLNGLIRSTRFFAPAATVDACALWELEGRFDNQAACLEHLRKFDTVFTMHFDRSSWQEIDSDVIASSLPSVVHYPTVTFSAFHPDVAFIFHKPFSGKFLASPLGPFNSALAFYGYRKGYGVSRTLSLFQEAVFEKLGYFSVWPISAKAMLQEPEAESFRFSHHLLTWARQGCFMYNPQHPKLGPIIDIALEMLKKAGHTSREADAKSYLPDDLISGPIWPVYPDIGSYYGISGGSYIFKRDAKSERWPEFMPLEEFVSASYVCYSENNIDEYYCDRVDSWIMQGADF